jgi:class 3 adenylate cyclase
VLDGKGDILKFAGDAVLIEWKATETINLENCVEAAVNCAAKIITRCSDFSVLANGVSGGSSCLITSQAAKVETLNVHCGIGAGQMIGVHVGDHELRREYLLLGQPIQQATVATDFASLGEVAISPEAHAILSRVCEFDEDITRINGKTPTVVGSRDALKFASKRRMGIHQPKVVNDVSRGVTHHVEGLEVDALKKYRRMMSLYVHPVVVDNDIASDDVKKARIRRIDRSAQERHRQEAEIRNVYVMFVNPVVETQVTKNEKANRQMYKLLNDIMNLSSREIKRFSGHLRQFIVDDKGAQKKPLST